MKVTRSYLKQLIKEELQIAEQAAVAPAQPQAAPQQQQPAATAPKPQAAGITGGQTGGLPQEVIAALASTTLWQLLEQVKNHMYSQLGTKVGQFVLDNATDILDMAASAAGMAEQNVPPPKQLSGGRISLRTNGAALAAAKAAAAKGVAAATKKGIKIGQPK
jgi:hypothetical protein